MAPIKLLAVMAVVIFAGCAHISTPGKLPQPLSGPELKKTKATEPLLDQAYLSYLNGEFDKAVNRFETALVMMPDRVQFWEKVALNYCYLATGQYRKAESLSQLLINERPRFPTAYVQKGVSLIWQKRYGEAIQTLETANDFDDHEPILHLYEAVAYSLMKKGKEREQQLLVGEGAYRAILRKNPSDIQALLELGYLYSYWGKNLEEGLALTREAEKEIVQSDSPEEKELWLRFYVPTLEGILLEKLKKPQEAVAKLSESVTHAPSGIRLDLAEAYYYLGRAYIQLQDTNKAQSFLRKALELDSLVLYAEEIETLTAGLAKETVAKP